MVQSSCRLSIRSFPAAGGAIRTRQRGDGQTQQAREDGQHVPLDGIPRSNGDFPDQITMPARDIGSSRWAPAETGRGRRGSGVQYGWVAMPAPTIGLIGGTLVPCHDMMTDGASFLHSTETRIVSSLLSGPKKG